MEHKLAFIHTSPVLVSLFSQMAREYLPEIEFFHMVDESLIRNTVAAGKLTKNTIRRLGNMIESAHDGGAGAVMVTCSSIGEGVSAAREQFDFPILRVDEAMAEEAVRIGGRIGVAATLKTTLDPTMGLLRDTARRANRQVELAPVLSDGAFEAVLAGDTARHDQLVAASLAELMTRVDVVVLAQASMTRVISQLPVDGGPPILSSPKLAILQARGLFASAGVTQPGW